MTIDNRLVLFSTSSIQAYTIASGMANVVNNSITVGGKTAPSVTDATGTNWVVVPDLDQLGMVSPLEDVTLGIYLSAGTATGTGTFLLTPTVSFGDDAATVKSSRVLAPITGVVTAGVLVPQYAQSPLPWISNHKYMKVNFVIALTTITGLSLTNFTIALENAPDSGIGRVGTNMS